MKINILLILSALIITTITSCKHEHDDTAPVITLATPTDQKDYAIGDTIFIHGDVTDNEALHELMVMLSKEETGEVVMHWMPVVHEMPSYHIDTFFVPTDTSHIHFNLVINAWDHDNNTSEINYTLHWAD
jgi:hypothetical protein